MYTIVETQDFERKAKKLWTEEERLEFFTYISQNPLDGDVIQHGRGLRKIRWVLENNKGKSGGVRIIYLNVLADGVILMWDIYAKSEKENISRKELNKLRGN